MSSDAEEDFTDDSNNDEEVVIEDSGSPEFEVGSFNEYVDISHLETNIHVAEAYMPDLSFRKIYNGVSIDIPTSFLPLSMITINGYDDSPILMNIEFELDMMRWDKPPISIRYCHPINGTSFIGRPLISERISKFFSPFYKPKKFYKSQASVMVPTGDINEDSLRLLVKEGFDQKRSRNALALTKNNLDKARTYLITGALASKLPTLEFNFTEFPLIYLILEITEAFLDIFDHCCVCGCELGISGLKACACSKKVCQFSFTQLGVGANVVAEIKRDYKVVDFLVSIASAANGTKFLVPAPPVDLLSEMKNFFDRLPSISSLRQFQNDQELSASIGPQFFEILRFIILSNRVHFITLPDNLCLKECKNETTQFLSLQASPEKELKFLEKKKKIGNAFLWHGSTVDRWHSILHTGLQDLGRTKDAQNGGPWYGDGVYQSDSAAVSQGYARFGPNSYKNSVLGKDLQILALVENAKGEKLNNVYQNEYTQQDNDALIVRCMMVVHKSFEWNTLSKPPQYVPNLHDVLKHFSSIHL